MTMNRPEEDSPQTPFDNGTRLQLDSADLLRHAAELNRRTALARQRFEAVQRRVLELKQRLELMGWSPRRGS